MASVFCTFSDENRAIGAEFGIFSVANDIKGGLKGGIQRRFGNMQMGITRRRTISHKVEPHRENDFDRNETENDFGRNDLFYFNNEDERP